MSEDSATKKYTLPEILIAVFILPIPLLVMQLISVFLLLLIPMSIVGLIALAFLGICILIGGIAMVGVGISKLFSMPMGALSIVGYGFANIGVALMTECFVLWVCTVAGPALVKKIRGNKEAKNDKAS